MRSRLASQFFPFLLFCPSSYEVAQTGAWHMRDFTHLSWLILCDGFAVLQAPVFDCFLLDPFSAFDD